MRLSKCKQCGENGYFARNFARIRDEAMMLRKEVVRRDLRIAHLELEATLREHRDRTDVAWLQGKVVAQKRELKRLNDAGNVSRIRAGGDVTPDVEVDSITAVEVVRVSSDYPL